MGCCGSSNTNEGKQEKQKNAVPETVRRRWNETDYRDRSG